MPARRLGMGWDGMDEHCELWLIWANCTVPIRQLLQRNNLDLGANQELDAGRLLSVLFNMGYRVTPFYKIKKQKKREVGGIWGSLRCLAPKRREHVRRLCGALRYRVGKNSGGWSPEGSTNFQEDWEGLGQGSHTRKVKEKHPTVSSQRLSWGTGKLSTTSTKDHPELWSRSALWVAGMKARVQRPEDQVQTRKQTWGAAMPRITAIQASTAHEQQCALHVLL